MKGGIQDKLLNDNKLRYKKEIIFVVKGGDKFGDKELGVCLTKGMEDRQRIVYRNGSVFNVYYKIYQCIDDGHFEVRGEKGWIDFGSHTVVDVRERYVGISRVMSVIDSNGLVNFLGEDGLSFDDEHWITGDNMSTTSHYSGQVCTIISSERNGETEWNVLNTMDMSVVFSEWGTKIKASMSVYGGYPRMKNTDDVPRSGCIYIKKKNGKVDVATVNRGIPFILTENIDDVVYDVRHNHTSHFFMICGGRSFLLGYEGNSVECSQVSKSVNVIGDVLFGKSGGRCKFIVVLDDVVVKGTPAKGTSAVIMRIMKSVGDFDGIYDKDSLYPVVMDDYKYNYVDLIKLTDAHGSEYLVSDKWFDDVFPAEKDANGEYVFRVKDENGWKDCFHPEGSSSLQPI